MSEEAPVPFPQVIVLSGPHKGDVFVIDNPFPVVFGSGVGVSLPEAALDHAHCQIFSAGDSWFLMDLASESGTWLGDERVEGVRPLEFGRTFRIGDTHLAFLLPDPEEPADPDFIQEAERALRAAVPRAAHLELADLDDLDLGTESGEDLVLPDEEDLIPEEAPLPGLEDSAELEPGEYASPIPTGGGVAGSGEIPEIPRAPSWPSATRAADRRTCRRQTFLTSRSRRRRRTSRPTTASATTT